MGMTDLLGEALVEHGLIEFMLYEADQAQGKKDFKFKCKVLREALEHHVEEEEDEFFPEVEQALGDERLEELGATDGAGLRGSDRRGLPCPASQEPETGPRRCAPADFGGNGDKLGKKVAARGGNHARHAR